MEGQDYGADRRFTGAPGKNLALLITVVKNRTNGVIIGKLQWEKQGKDLE